VHCAIVGCKNQSLGFFKFPKVVKDQGIQVLAITSIRRLARPMMLKVFGIARNIL